MILWLCLYYVCSTEESICCFCCVMEVNKRSNTTYSIYFDGLTMLLHRKSKPSLDMYHFHTEEYQITSGKTPQTFYMRSKWNIVQFHRLNRVFWAIKPNTNCVFAIAHTHTHTPRNIVAILFDEYLSWCMCIIAGRWWNFKVININIWHALHSLQFGICSVLIEWYDGMN